MAKPAVYRFLISFLEYDGYLSQIFEALPGDTSVLRQLCMKFIAFISFSTRFMHLRQLTQCETFLLISQKAVHYILIKTMRLFSQGRFVRAIMLCSVFRYFRSISTV